MRSSAILTRCPDQRSCARLMCCSMPVCAQRCRTSVFGIMSCHLMLAMRLKQRMWNWSSLRMCRRYGVHASHPYSSVGSTTALVVSRGVMAHRVFELLEFRAKVVHTVTTRWLIPDMTSHTTSSTRVNHRIG